MFGFGKKDASQDITAGDLAHRLRTGDGLLLVDVREPWEFSQGHIAGSKLIPLDHLSTQLARLPRDKTLVAVCRTGNRSSVATSLLKRAGYDVLNLKGGVVDWARSGLPLSGQR